MSLSFVFKLEEPRRLLRKLGNSFPWKNCMQLSWFCFLQGSVAIAGAVVRWLRDNLGIVKTSQEVGEYLQFVAVNFKHSF